MGLYFIAVAAVVIVGVFFTVWIVYDKHHLNQEGEERSFILYILGCLISGFLGGVIVNLFVLNFVCSGDAGAGCAFGVVALMFPFSFAIGIACFMLIWSNQGQHVIND